MHQLVGKKDTGVKISLERDLSDRDEFQSYDDVIVLPDFSFQNRIAEEDEPVVVKKPVDQNKKPNTHVKRPYHRGNSQLAKDDSKKKKFYFSLFYSKHFKIK